MGEIVETNGIQLHYLNYPGEGETLVLLHGLSANAHSFGGFISAGLDQYIRVISVDLRGRGLSSKPDSGYTLVDHAQDILGLLDTLGLEQVILGGHSYGGRLAIYMAVHHAARVKKLILIDTGFFHPKVAELVMPSIMRLDKTVASWDTYIKAIQQSPPYHGGFWDEALEAYYRADVALLDDGSVKPHSKLAHIIEAAQIAQAEDWEALMKQVVQPAILLHAPDGFGPGDTPPILPEEGARRTADLFDHCEYKQMVGNHMTMLFGENAQKVVDEIVAFVAS